MITQESLKELLHYNPDSGDFVWLETSGIKAGHQAGSINSNRYIYIQIAGVKYSAHRLAWMYVHGGFPPEDIDHINRKRADNRLANLRPATRSENQHNRGAYANNTSGFKGVSWRKRGGKWLAHIKLHGVSKHIGCFSDIQDAVRAYAAAVEKYHGLEFGRVE